jgi:chromosome segregation ATPase
MIEEKRENELQAEARVTDLTKRQSEYCESLYTEIYDLKKEIKARDDSKKDHEARTRQAESRLQRLEYDYKLKEQRLSQLESQRASAKEDIGSVYDEQAAKLNSIEDYYKQMIKRMEYAHA